METEHRNTGIFLSAGVVSILGYGLLTYISGSSPPVLHFIALYGALFILFSLSAYIVFRKPLAENRFILFAIILFAIVFRFISIPGEPLFDDDIHRYMWDGKVWAGGINPYMYPPSDFHLMDLRDDNWEGINYKEIPTIYPPLAQMIFRASRHIAPNHQAAALKGIFLIFDLGIIASIIVMLRLLAIPASRVILYAWNPLVIKEFANSGHLDVAAIFFVALFCLLTLKGWRGLSAVALGLAILTKLYPLVLLPVLIRYFRPRHFLIIAAVLVLGYAPFLDAREFLFDGLVTYAGYWEFNDSGFALLNGLLRLFTDSPELIAKVLVITGLTSLGLYLSHDAARDNRSRMKAFFFVIGGLLIFSPTVDTWYITWIVPFLCFYPSRSWLILCGTAVIAYCYFWQGRDFWWIRTIEYLPFYISLIGTAFLAKGYRLSQTFGAVQAGEN